MLVTKVNGITNSVKFGCSRRNFFETQGIKTYRYVLAKAECKQIVKRVLVTIQMKWLLPALYQGAGISCDVWICVGATGGNSDAKICDRHPGHMQKYYCDDCSVSICDVCVEESGCKFHRRSPVAAVAERLRQDIDRSFTGANTLISQKKAELESRLRALSDEKDRALLRIDSAFEAHMHTLGRRATLLKNKVIDVYNENSNNLESGLEEIDTAMTCVVSLREYHEAAVDHGDFDSVLVDQGTAEIDEVARNIADRVRPPEIHIVFDGDHGIEKFRSCSKDLGRVVCNRSAPRPPDVTPTDIMSPVASASTETDEFAGGDSFPVNQMHRCSIPGLAAEEALAAHETSLIVDGITGIGDMPNKMAARPMSMVTNNNYFSPHPQLGLPGCKFAPAVTNVNIADPQSRICASYDEHRLQRELASSAGGGEDTTYCMSRSDYWPHGTCTEPIVNDNSDQGNVIVELSGEQTTL